MVANLMLAHYPQVPRRSSRRCSCPVCCRSSRKVNNEAILLPTMAILEGWFQKGATELMLDKQGLLLTKMTPFDKTGPRPKEFRDKFFSLV